MERGRMFRVQRDPEFGQFLQATEDIPAGTIINEESPSFYGPSADYVSSYDTPVCLVCCIVMNDGNEGNRCEQCKWPLCGNSQCDKAPLHVDYECDLLAKVPFPPPQLPIQNCYKGLTILRGLLLKQNNPEMWEKVMNLQHENEIRDSEEQDFNEEFKTQFGLPNFGTNEDWKRILGILNVNSYSIQRIEKKIGSPTFAEFIYPFQCLMNHSCIPNCNWAVTYSPEFIIKAKASVDIKKGEMLTVAYNYDLSKYGCHKRQQRIRENSKFSCKCPLCLDPSELGTFTAGILCFKCKKGFMLPLDSIDPESDWKCNECPYKMCESFVSSFVDSLQEQVEMAVADAEETGESVVDVLEEIISENSESVVHPNHWVLMMAMAAIINHQSSRICQLSLENLDRLITHCEHILKIRNIITPGISTEKGLLQHHIARAKFRKLEIAIEQQSLLLPNSDTEEEEVKAIYAMQKCAKTFWEDNPHYGTLHANYKLDFQLLKHDMEQLEAKYPFLSC